MRRIFVFFLMPLPLYAQDLGVYGQTFPIAEEHFLEALQRKLKGMEEAGELLKRQKEMTERARTKLHHPLPVVGISKTQTPRQWLYDPSLTVDKDILDAQGNVIAAQGTTVNPLDMLSWGAPLLFLEGGDPEQVAWAKRQDSLSKWVLVKGSPLDLEESLKRPVYFDQAGTLTRKFGIEQVPCRVTQKGNKLLVEELVIPLEEKKK